MGSVLASASGVEWYWNNIDLPMIRIPAAASVHLAIEVELRWKSTSHVDTQQSHPWGRVPCWVRTLQGTNPYPTGKGTSTSKVPKGRGIVQCENTPKNERLLHLKITQLERKSSEPTFTFGCSSSGLYQIEWTQGLLYYQPKQGTIFRTNPSFDIRLIPQNR